MQILRALAASVLQGHLCFSSRLGEKIYELKKVDTTLKSQVLCQSYRFLSKNMKINLNNSFEPPSLPLESIFMNVEVQLEDQLCEQCQHGRTKLRPVLVQVVKLLTILLSLAMLKDLH